MSCSVLILPVVFFIFFFFNDTATTEIYTLSLHDALPILRSLRQGPLRKSVRAARCAGKPIRRAHLPGSGERHQDRSEEDTPGTQSQPNFLFRLMLQKKKIRAFDGQELRPGLDYLSGLNHN